MRAKRSKKYRKIMSAYQMSFSFREPYQVLLDSNFIRTCHAFHMPMAKYLANTLHGDCLIFVTQCTLAKIMADHQAAGGHPKSRPDFLPPPLDLPLRYCKHKNSDGDDAGVVGEAQCLIDLLAGQPQGNELAKNKQHYVLATADAQDQDQRRGRHIDVRERARMIPGVPIVYVKRSVMILEELSGASEAVRRGQERDKFREGLVGSRKRKRAEDDQVEERPGDADTDHSEPPKRVKAKGQKGPNPMSVMKRKVKETTGDRSRSTNETEQDTGQKAKRRGTRGAKKPTVTETAEGVEDNE